MIKLSLTRLGAVVGGLAFSLARWSRDRVRGS